MKQIERITYMESILDEATEVISKLENNLDDYLLLLPKLNELIEYYDGEWRHDYEDDELGKLPRDLKRGVLSEDAVYNLLVDHREVINSMSRILELYKEKD